MAIRRQRQAPLARIYGMIKEHLHVGACGCSNTKRIRRLGAHPHVPHPKSSKIGFEHENHRIQYASAAPHFLPCMTESRHTPAAPAVIETRSRGADQGRRRSAGDDRWRHLHLEYLTFSVS